MKSLKIRRIIYRTAAVIVLCACPALAQTAQSSREPGLQDIVQYIARGWTTLTRSMNDCDTLIDPKVPEKSVLYLPADLPVPSDVAALRQKCNIRVEHLPNVIKSEGDVDLTNLPPGLLYLPNPYVVPGGRFNEMYGWDSYFIMLGLIRDGRINLARGMVDNFIFEVEHYGAVLNANRTYYLKRSQPPFLTSMILAVYEAETKTGKTDREWLATAYAAAKRDHHMWTTVPHLAGTTGLSRYYALGEGPVQEETDTYRQVTLYFLKHLNTRYFTPVASVATVAPSFTLYACGKEQTLASGQCEQVQTVGLTREYYKGDRSMRESGFDISFRFGPFGADTQHYAPVCLNSLLYKSERDLQQIASLLGRRAESRRWEQEADRRRATMQRLFWNAERAQFFDYDVTRNKRSDYEFATTFFPLWAGWATPQQAESLVKRAGAFAQPGGIVTSRTQSGVQWDWPYGWAPLQLITVEGLRRYGFNAEANDIATHWLSMVVENFRKDGSIREKYNVVTRSSEVLLTAGYSANVVGFGWTNGVFLKLLQELPRPEAQQIK